MVAVVVPIPLDMQFYYAEEPASPLDFDRFDGDDGRDPRDGRGGEEDSFYAVSATASVAAKSMAPAISRAGAFRELTHSLRSAAR